MRNFAHSTMNRIPRILSCLASFAALGLFIILFVVLPEEG